MLSVNSMNMPIPSSLFVICPEKLSQSSLSRVWDASLYGDSSESQLQIEDITLALTVASPDGFMEQSIS